MEIIMKLIRFIITFLAIVFIAIFMACFSLGVKNIGNICGIGICILLIFKFGFYKKYEKIKKQIDSKKFSKIIRKTFSICVTIFTVYAIIISGLMITVSLIKPKSNSTAIILGAKVNPNGPSVALWNRICAGEKYLKENPNSKVVVTGGQGQDEITSEAQCMYECLTEKGIQRDRIYQEDKATDTMENIDFSYKIIKENNLDDNLAITTDSYHQLRARIIAHKLKINTEIGSVNAIPDSKIGIIIYPSYFIREWFAIPWEIIK